MTLAERTVVYCSQGARPYYPKGSFDTTHYFIHSLLDIHLLITSYESGIVLGIDVTVMCEIQTFL